MRKKIIWITSVLVLLIVLLIVLKSKGVIGEEEGVKVAVEKVEPRTIIETVNASGRIYPEIEVKVSPDISGEITELNVQEGDSVKKGQILARIYADIYTIQQQQAVAVVNQQQFQVGNSQAQLEGLKSALEQAVISYNRQKQLLADKVISQSELELAENTLKNASSSFNALKQTIEAGQAGVKSAQASLARASKDVLRATLIAPMNGVVSLLNVKAGERVVGTAQMAGTEMMRIADMNSLEIRVDVTENDIPKVHIGDSAEVMVDAYINQKFKGIVYQIASSQNGAILQAATTTSSDVTNYKVFIRLLSSSYAHLMNPTKPRSFPFRPGMTASADIQTKTRANILSVPINAVTTRDKNSTAGSEKKEDDKKTENEQNELDATNKDKEVVVFILDKSTQKVKKMVVETGVQDTRYIEITKGLKEGNVVIAEPYNTIFRLLNEGDKVLVVDRSKLFEMKK